MLAAVAAASLSLPVESQSARAQAQASLQPGGAGEAILARLAFLTDTHYWPPSDARTRWVAASDAAPERDGLLVNESAYISALGMAALADFKDAGGAMAVHLGDAVNGGGSFHMPLDEYSAALYSLRAAQEAALGEWPVLHIPGNHDLGPDDYGGLDEWRAALGPRAADAPTDAARSAHPPLRATSRALTEEPSPAGGANYRSILAARGWRLLLLDSTDGLHTDVGHGHVGAAQLSWLESELTRSAMANERVIIGMHQLLVPPVGMGPIGEAGDLIDNGHEVIALLGRYPHVTLSLHGHVHANTATTMRLAGGHELTLMSLASTTEYPLQWHEVTLRPCALELRHRPIDAPELANASLLRENRPGFARVKNQSAADPGLYIRTC